MDKPVRYESQNFLALAGARELRKQEFGDDPKVRAALQQRFERAWKLTISHLGNRSEQEE
jgi:hypothetical protein